MDEAAIQDAIAKERARLRSPPRSNAGSLSNTQKLVLFRRLFRGREDVFPRRWESTTGKAGYSPVCSNLWKPGICEIRKVRCGECPNQAYAALTDRVVADHLPRFVTGLTATPYRRDGQQPIIHMQCGPTRFEINPRQQQALRPLARRLIVRETGFAAPDLASERTVQPYYAALVADKARNALILADVERALAEGRSPILLSERKEHLETLATYLRPRDYVDAAVPMLAGMFRKRLRGYRGIGYEPGR